MKYFIPIKPKDAQISAKKWRNHYKTSSLVFFLTIREFGTEIEPPSARTLGRRSSSHWGPNSWGMGRPIDHDRDRRSTWIGEELLEWLPKDAPSTNSSAISLPIKQLVFVVGTEDGRNGRLMAIVEPAGDGSSTATIRNVLLLGHRQSRKLTVIPDQELSTRRNLLAVVHGGDLERLLRLAQSPSRFTKPRRGLDNERVLLAVPRNSARDRETWIRTFLHLSKGTLLGVVPNPLNIGDALWTDIQKHAGFPNSRGASSDVPHLFLHLPLFNTHLLEQDGFNEVLLPILLDLVAKVVLHHDAFCPRHGPLGFDVRVDSLTIIITQVKAPWILTIRSLLPPREDVSVVVGRIARRTSFINITNLVNRAQHLEHAVGRHFGHNGIHVDMGLVREVDLLGLKPKIGHFNGENHVEISFSRGSGSP